MRLAKRCVACDGERLGHVPAVLMPFIADRIFGWRPTEISPEWGLRDIPAGHGLQHLQDDDVRRLRHAVSRHAIRRRGDGGALWRIIAERPIRRDRDRFEPGYAARNAIMLEGSDYIDQIEAILEPYLGARPRVLDWGGDTGVNTPFRSRAMQHDVYDISNRPMVEGARAVDLDAVKANVYDLIVFSQCAGACPLSARVSSRDRERDAPGNHSLRRGSA